MEENKKVFADPTSWITFIFSMCVWAVFGSYIGLFKGDTYLILGIMMLGCFPAYMIGAVMYAKNQNSMMACFYFVFGVVFGTVCGGIYIAYFFDGLYSLGLDPTIIGVPFIVSAVFILPAIPLLLYADKVSFITWTAADIWLFAAGLSYFGVAPFVTYIISVITCLIVGIGTAYIMCSEVSVCCGGQAYPMGNPIKKGY